MSQTLFPITWFLRAGCDAVFTGRSSSEDKSSGHGKISLYELTEKSKDYKGTLALNCWNDLWFFKYSIFSPVRHDAASAITMSASIQKYSATKIFSNSQSSRACRTRLGTQGSRLENARRKRKWSTTGRFTLLMHHLHRVENRSPIFRKIWQYTYSHVLGHRWIFDIYRSIFLKCHECPETARRNRTDIRPGRIA